MLGVYLHQSFPHCVLKRTVASVQQQRKVKILDPGGSVTLDPMSQIALIAGLYLFSCFRLYVFTNSTNSECSMSHEGKKHKAKLHKSQYPSNFCNQSGLLTELINNFCLHVFLFCMFLDIFQAEHATSKELEGIC